LKSESVLILDIQTSFFFNICNLIYIFTLSFSIVGTQLVEVVGRDEAE